MVKIQNTNNTNVSMSIEKKNNSHSLSLGIQNGTITLEDIWWFLTELNMYILHNSASFGKELKARLYMNVYKETHKNRM